MKQKTVLSILMLILFAAPLSAEIWSAPAPLVILKDGAWYFPAFKTYAPQTFGVEDQARMRPKNYASLKNSWKVFGR